MWDPMPVSPEEDAQVAAAYPPNMLSKLNVRNPVLAVRAKFPFAF